MNAMLTGIYERVVLSWKNTIGGLVLGFLTYVAGGQVQDIPSWVVSLAAALIAAIGAGRKDADK